MSGAPFGAVNLYRLRPGPLSDDQHATALVVVDTLRSMQAQAQVDQLSVELERSANLHPGVAPAAGMVSVQLDVTVTQAMIHLPAVAYRQGRRSTRSPPRSWPAR